MKFSTFVRKWIQLRMFLVDFSVPCRGGPGSRWDAETGVGQWLLTAKPHQWQSSGNYQQGQ